MEVQKVAQRPKIEFVEEEAPKEVSATISEKKEEDAAPNEEYERIDVYEQEKGHRVAEDYFKVRDLMSEDFNVKMNVLAIDKYVKGILKERGMDKTVPNFNATLKEIEEEIGSGKLDVFARLTKLVNYTKIIQKLNKAKEDKEAFLSV